MSQDWVKDNLAFRKACKLPVSSKLTWLDADQVSLHFRLMREELGELKEALDSGSMDKVADAYADLIYYAIGGALAHGIDLRPVWDAVHEANMKKTAGPKREDGKQLKPEGWEPPNIWSALQKGKLDELC